MLDFLSPQWIAALATAAPDGTGADGLSVEHFVPDAPSGPVRYRLVISDGGARVDVEPDGQADLTVETDYATAVRLHRGEWNAQDAAASGHLKLQGRVGILRDTRELISGLGDLFGDVRADTDTPTPRAS